MVLSGQSSWWRGGEAQGYQIRPLSLHLPASLTAKGKICITAEPRTAELCPAGHAAENAVPLQHTTLLGWWGTVRHWHYSVSLQPPGTDKCTSHIPHPRGTLQHFTGTQDFTKRPGTASKQHVALALGVSMRSLARSFVSDVNSRKGHRDSRGRAEGAGASGFIVLQVILQNRGVPLGARTGPGPLL